MLRGSKEVRDSWFLRVPCPTDQTGPSTRQAGGPEPWLKMEGTVLSQPRVQTDRRRRIAPHIQTLQKINKELRSAWLGFILNSPHPCEKSFLGTFQALAY